MSPEVDEELRRLRERTMERVQAVWEGEADVDHLDELVTSGYVGHIGSRQRDLATLKADIRSYRASAADVRFVAEYRFGEADHIATRWTAHALDPRDGRRLVAAGLNISRWDGDRLAEEWAVWEPLHAVG